MAWQYFVIALKAANPAENIGHLKAYIIPSVWSVAKLMSINLASLKRQLPARDGWELWGVSVVRISQKAIKQVIEESHWFDQEGAHRLYGIAVLAQNASAHRHALVAASLITFSRSRAEDELKKYTEEHFPESQGWQILGTHITTWDEDPRPEPGIQYVPPGTTTH